MRIPLADTEEWDDTDRDIVAQAPVRVLPAMFEDTGVVIVDRPAEPMLSPHLVVTFRQPTKVPPPLEVTFAECSRVEFPDESPTEVYQSTATVRAATAPDWPPAPRAPAQEAPKIRERAFKHAGVYTVVARPGTKGN